MAFSSIFSFILPGLSEHFRILRKLRAGTKGDIFRSISLTILTVFFEAWGIAMVLPIIAFLRSDSDAVIFAESSKIGKYIVEFYSFIGIPVNLLTLCTVVIIMITVRQTLNFVYTLYIDGIKLRVGRDLSIRCFESIMRSSAQNIGTYRAGQFATLVQHECQAAASVVRNYSRILSLTTTFGIYIVIMFSLAPTASIAALLLVGAIVLALGRYINATRRLSETRIQVRARLISYLSERFGAWRLIKTSNAVEYERDQMTILAQKDMDTEFAVVRVGGKMQLYLTPAIMFLALYTLYFTIEYLDVEIEKVAIFMLILMRLVPTSQSLNGQRNQLASYEPSLHLIDRTLDQGLANAEALHVGAELPLLRNGIVFENVSFGYPGEENLVLRNVSVSIPSGKMTALVGHSGAGKSTLIDLILRLYMPSKGRVLYDGVPLQDFNLASFRKGIAYIDQEPLIFDVSVFENIRYARRDATIKEVREAAKLANALDFIERLPQGFETSLGEHGARLSGGEKQRIALARTFLSGAKVIIMDEPTSALDLESERKIKEVIEDLVKNMGITAIIVSHRDSTIENADKVLEFEKGRLLDISNTAAEIN
jgi:ABC-type multidrug transport system fused ATPase/permease subunit